MAQRLIRTLCPSCKSEHKVTDAQWQDLVEPFNIRKPNVIYKAAGCEVCRNTGYLGRIGIYELFKNTGHIQKQITETCDANIVTKLALKDGMKTLRLSGVEKVIEGISSIEEVLRVAPENIEK